MARPACDFSYCPTATKERVDRAREALALCCTGTRAKEGDDGLKSLQSMLSKSHPFKKSTDGSRTRRRLQTELGNGYLVSCSARTLHDHQPSGAKLGSSNAYVCHICAYIGHLINELEPESKLATWGPAARRFHWVLKNAIKGSCKEWHGQEISCCVEGQLTALDLSLANLHSTMTNPELSNWARRGLRRHLPSNETPRGSTNLAEALE